MAGWRTILHSTTLQDVQVTDDLESWVVQARSQHSAGDLDTWCEPLTSKRILGHDDPLPGDSPTKCLTARRVIARRQIGAALKTRSAVSHGCEPLYP